MKNKINRIMILLLVMILAIHSPLMPIAQAESALSDGSETGESIPAEPNASDPTDAEASGDAEATTEETSGEDQSQIAEQAEDWVVYTDVFQGKVFGVIGDSISTFAGYIPVEDGFNKTHRPRYPQDNLLTDVNETWWMQTIMELGGKLGINDSWAGSMVFNNVTAEVSGDNGTKASISSPTRIQNLGANGTPDVIMLYGGTNDFRQGKKLGTFDPDTAPTEPDLTTLVWDTVADAYVATIMRLQYYYPDAMIIALLPAYNVDKDEATTDKYDAVFAKICEHYGIPYADMRTCGLKNSTDHLPDKIHPNATGMDFMTKAVLKLLQENADGVEAGEHTVYTVSHDLTYVKASLGHWKGVDAGGAFKETLTGRNMTVTVTMNGVDITSSCYADGVISIEEVTGPLVITAEGDFQLGDHLQQIPANAYNDTNLWSVLKPEEGYFKGTEWVADYYSVTVPVTGGDRLKAYSFGAAGSNGNNKTNGIRVTYYNEHGEQKQMAPAEVYSEYSAKGYLTVPDGATAVCVPMWTNGGSEYFYILTLPERPDIPEICEGHIQQIPEDASCDTNLWDVLTPEGCYYSSSGWSTKYPSVTVPVSAGDRLYASDFGPKSETGGENDGIRVTYFNKNGVLNSIKPTDVYAEFKEKGYLTVPEGATAVCIPMWKDDSNAEFRILTLPTKEGYPFICADRIQKIPKDAYNSTNLLTKLDLDDGYYQGSSGWGGKYKSVTVPVSGGDQLWATSFGAVNKNGGDVRDGIRVTYFDRNGVMESVDPDVVYKEFKEKGYLTVPEGATAVNVPFWSETDAEFRILTLPTIWEEHLQQIPEDAYNDTNLWSKLTAEAKYFNGTDWVTGFSSVTVPVTGGDQLWAYSFGAKNTNGSSSKDGIRVTYFDKYGVKQSIAPADVYNEFEKYGYLTVPDGAEAVCIAMWENDDTADFRILTLPDRPVLTVEITWGTMEYTYRDNIWNPENHSYEGSWESEEGSNAILVSNIGGLPATVTFLYESTNGYSFTGTFSDGVNEIASPVPLPAGENYTAYLSISGRPETYITEFVSIGEVTVKIE